VTPSKDSYDAVVIGSGIAGLAAGAFLANAGRSVLMCEQSDGPGGYARAFKRGDYIFDPAIHATPQAHDYDLPAAIYRYLGIDDRLEFIKSHVFYEAAFPNFRLRPPPGFEAFVETHVEAFPHEADRIRDFFRVCETVQREAHERPPQLSLQELDEAARQFPTLFKYSKATLGEVIDEYLTDPKLRAVVAALWPYAGLPPSRLSFVVFATFVRVIVDGSFYLKGSFQSLVDALLAAFERDGGELLVNAPVVDISIEDGHVGGIGLQNGTRVKADVVVSNADAVSTLESMVGLEHFPAGFARRLSRMRPSLSAVVVFGATNMDLTKLDLAHETFFFTSFDHDQTYDDILAGRPGGMWASVPTLADPSVAPPGEHLVILSSMAAYDIGRPWQHEADRFAEEMWRAFEPVAPGVRESLSFMETATPLALERYTRNHQGAAYGWENSPDQAGSKRSPRHPPIDGLYLTGHWTPPGSTSLRVLVSGVHTAMVVLADTGGPSIDLKHPELPPI
jgi:prolycopene isomerase